MDDSRAPHDQAPRLGVLLVNLGSPEAPSPRAIRRYLREFLSDSRVIEIPRLLWLAILYLLVLPFRPGRIAKGYQAIWTDRGSPLTVYTADLASSLQIRMAQRFPGPVTVDWAMRYGSPSIHTKLSQLKAAGAERLLIVPLYPQYSGTTTASVFDAVTATLRGWRWIPELRFVTAYHDHGAYIDALCESVRNHPSSNSPEARHLVMSFHGIPQRYIEQGDPYFCHCHKTARLLADALDLKPGEYSVSFQSQFGKAQWVGPSTSDTLTQLAETGTKELRVVCPGFAADCIETLEEIQIENRDIFRDAGGATLHYVPALNATQGHVQAMESLVIRHASGWPEALGDSAQRDRRNAPHRVRSLEDGA
jgi:ferrochelatase